MGVLNDNSLVLNPKNTINAETNQTRPDTKNTDPYASLSDPLSQRHTYGILQGHVVHAHRIDKRKVNMTPKGKHTQHQNLINANAVHK